MTITTSGTINRTSFAVAMLDANTLLLDALALTGEERLDKFASAQRRARHALGQTDVLAEEMLARQLLHYIQEAQLKKWDV